MAKASDNDMKFPFPLSLDVLPNSHESEKSFLNNHISSMLCSDPASHHYCNTDSKGSHYFNNDPKTHNANEREVKTSSSSSTFNFESIEDALKESCNSSLKCASFPDPCNAVFIAPQNSLGNGPLNLSERVKGIFNKSDKLEEKNTKITYIHPNNVKEKVSKVKDGIPDATLPCLPDSKLHVHVDPYGDTDVVRTQPTGGGLLTTACSLMTSSSYCTCVNPGPTHACATRPSHRSSLGVLNPMFEIKSSTSKTSSKDKASRRLSLDSVSKLRAFDLPNIPTNSTVPPRDESFGDKQKTEENNLIAYGDNKPFSLTEGTYSQLHPSMYAALSQQLTESIGNKVTPAGIALSTHSNSQNSSAALHDWISVLSPSSPEAFAQGLFTPDDLRDELLYPAPYGIDSEVFQNLNAREAGFVLQKPNRKPKADIHPPTSVPSKTTYDQTTFKTREKTSPLLASDENKKLEEMKPDHRRHSLSERRKSSLDKLFIPTPGEHVNKVLDIKVDNFDREEYVKFKKRLSDSNILKSDLLGINRDSCPVRPFSLQTVGMRKDMASEQINGIQSRKKADPMFGESFMDCHSKRNTSKCYQLEEKEKPFSTSLRRDGNFCKKPKEIPVKMRKDFSTLASLNRNIRKQSLPTEEIFGVRRAKAPRKTSLNPLMDQQALERLCFKSSLFSPVKELDETILNFGGTTQKQHPHAMKQSDSKRDERNYTKGYKGLKCESPERRRRVANKCPKQKQEPLSPNKTEGSRKSKGKSGHKREKKSVDDGKHSQFKNPSRKSHHQYPHHSRDKYQKECFHKRKDEFSIKDHMISEKSLEKSQWESISKPSKRSKDKKSHKKRPLSPGLPSESLKLHSRPLSSRRKEDLSDPFVPYEILKETPTPTSFESYSLPSELSSRLSEIRKHVAVNPFLSIPLGIFLT
ncbi:hypothetical protein SK128_016984 [Halocaridina rubra]|uniref:Uncharacterized protein n=1 Tax=Halocaridina rubra TaxID=373956 RepID=A0AAN8WQV8_HALRR